MAEVAEEEGCTLRFRVFGGDMTRTWQGLLEELVEETTCMVQGEVDGGLRMLRYLADLLLLLKP